MARYIGELRAIAEAVRASNRDGFGATASELGNALDDVAETTQWMLTAMAEGRQEEVLAGATAYLRQFGLVAGGAYLAKAGLASGDENRAHLARFFAENFLSECRAIKSRVMFGASSMLAARQLLDVA